MKMIQMSKQTKIFIVILLIVSLAVASVILITHITAPRITIKATPTGQLYIEANVCIDGMFIFWETDAGNIRPVIFNENLRYQPANGYYSYTAANEMILWNVVDHDGNDFSSATIRAYLYKPRDNQTKYEVKTVIANSEITVQKIDGIFKSVEERIFGNPVRADGKTEWSQVFPVYSTNARVLLRYRTGTTIERSEVIRFDSKLPLLYEFDFNGLPIQSIKSSDNGKESIKNADIVFLDFYSYNSFRFMDIDKNVNHETNETILSVRAYLYDTKTSTERLGSEIQYLYNWHLQLHADYAVGWNLFIPPFMHRNDFEEQNHVKMLNEHQSAFSIAYLNSDGTKTLYLFSSPIAYLRNDEYVFFDNQIRAIDSELLLNSGYKYTNSSNNISSLFPYNLNNNPIQILSEEFALKYIPYNSIFGNALHDASKNSISYSYADKVLNVTPTALGVNNKIIGESLSNSYIFEFEIQENFQIDDSAPEYIIIRNNRDIMGILYKPMLYAVNSEGETVFSYQSRIIYKFENGKHLIIYELDSQFIEENRNSSLTMNFNINHHRSKQPDSPVFSDSPTINRYLTEFTFVGRDVIYGNCKKYVRFEKLSNVPLEDIISVEYGITSIFYRKGSKVYLNRVSEVWCSLNLSWNTRPSHAEIIDEITVTNNQIHFFDITSLYKLWRNNIYNDESEYSPHNGFVLRSDDEDDLVVFASNDNAQNVPFIRITFI